LKFCPNCTDCLCNCPPPVCPDKQAGRQKKITASGNTVYRYIYIRIITFDSDYIKHAIEETLKRLSNTLKLKFDVCIVDAMASFSDGPERTLHYFEKLYLNNDIKRFAEKVANVELYRQGSACVCMQSVQDNLARNLNKCSIKHEDLFKMMQMVSFIRVDNIQSSFSLPLSSSFI
jgi:hypothetical protein